MKVPAAFQRKRARIEIVPLIDIIFFLLATFMMVSISMVKNQGIAVNLPVAKTSSPQEQTALTTITLTEEGALYWNKELISLEQLRKNLKILKTSEENPSVLINGDDKVDFGQAIGVLDEIRLLGIQKVSIQTKAQTKE